MKHFKWGSRNLIRKTQLWVKVYTISSIFGSKRGLILNLPSIFGASFHTYVLLNITLFEMYDKILKNYGQVTPDKGNPEINNFQKPFLRNPIYVFKLRCHKLGDTL